MTDLFVSDAGLRLHDGQSDHCVHGKSLTRECRECATQLEEDANL